MYVWKCLNDPPVRRCILAVALQPTKYLPLAAAAAALASHTFGAMRRATVLHRQLQKSLKTTLLDALTKRCEEPLAKLLNHGRAQNGCRFGGRVPSQRA